LLALPQRNVKRMLADSSIAHAGYLLVAIAAATSVAAPEAGGDALLFGAFTVTGLTRTAGGESLLYYLAAYTVTAVGAFGVAAAIERKDESPMAWDLDRFSGLARRRPVLAAFMATFLVSLAGIPPTAGFMGKLLVFRAAIEAQQYALAIVGVITSAIGAYYYLRVVVHMYFHAPEPELGVPEARSATLDGSLGVAFVLVFALGLGPDRVLELARLGANLLF
ncbi:MAG: NADH-quinone oxidoreductase subunit N, partial [Deltaproteobacteria bacterium]|nr:NADH-quinone oxidoreductase subunit N [Deltaproteobacteria bacterium]